LLRSVNDVHTLINEYKEAINVYPSQHTNKLQVEIFKYITRMANEYVFDYDEVKRRFESVPQTNSMSKKFKSMTYKTRFQPRTKSTVGKNTQRSNTYPLMANQIQQQETISPPTVMFKLQVIHLLPIIPIEQFSLQTQQGFYLIK
jgi:hypothetical protein